MIKAYKVKEPIETEENNTLNLVKDRLAVELLGFNYVDNGLNKFGEGIIKLEKEKVKDALREINLHFDDYANDYNEEIVENTKEIIENVLNDIGDKDYAKYKCK